MGLHHLSLTDFRNFSKISFNFTPTINFLIGKNGSGKTSILEALHLLSTGRSFRTTNLNRTINFNSDNAVIYAEAQGLNGLDYKIGYKRDHKNNKYLKLNNNDISSVAHIAAVLPMCCIEGVGFRALLESPQLRRRILDWGVFHVEHSFYEAWQKYNKVLKQRNVYLKQNPGRDYYDTWDALFAKAALNLMILREKYFKALKPYFDAHIQKLLPIGKIDVVLKQGIDGASEEEILSELKSSLPKDRERGFTSIGPHKADLIFKFKNIQAKESLSRGQQKMVILALYLAQLEYLKLATDKRCLILIDDIASELDQNAQQMLYRELYATNHQVVITAVNVPQLEHLKDLVESSNIINIATYDKEFNVSRETNKMV